MKRYTAPIIFIGLSILFAVLLMPFTEDPEIYAIAHVEEAGVFKNPIALKQISQEKSADFVPLMQEFFDTSATIVLNVRLKNFEDAEKELAEYQRMAKQFDRLVVNLDMSNSEIGEFRKNNAENMRNLEELITDSVAFDELNRLEIQYQDENDPNKMYSITYEGEALREKIKQGYGKYEHNSAGMAQSWDQLDINHTKMNASVKTLAEFIEEVDDTQRERMVRNEGNTVTFNEDLTLAIDPISGMYGDAINATGEFSQTGNIPAGEPVTLFIDSREYARDFCSSTGEYRIPFTLQQLYPGTHLAYTRAGDVFSPITFLFVSGTEGIVTCNVSVRGNTITSSGRLTTEGRDVSNAPVTIYIASPNNETQTTVYTDYSGTYSYSAEMKPGDYSIVSEFSDSTFPIYDCRSSESIVSVGKTNLFLYLVLFMIIASGAGYLFFRRRNQRETAEESSLKTANIFDIPDATLSPEEYPEFSVRGDEIIQKESIPIQEYRSRYLSARTKLTPVDASHILRDGFILAVGKYSGQKSRLSETLREHAAKLDSPSREQADVFVRHYEAIVYGSEQHDGDDLLVAWDEIIARLGNT